MKKYLAFVMALVMTLSLATVGAQAALVVDDGGEVVVNGDMEVTGTLNVKDGAECEVAGDVDFALTADVTVDGDMTVGRNLDNKSNDVKLNNDDATLTIKGSESKNEGTITVTKGELNVAFGKLTNVLGATISVLAGGKVDGMSNNINLGTATVNASATLDTPNFAEDSTGADSRAATKTAEAYAKADAHTAGKPLASGDKITVTFSEVMKSGTYTIVAKKSDGTDGAVKVSGALVEAAADSKDLVITLPATITGNDLQFGGTLTITAPTDANGFVGATVTINLPKVNNP